jgi:hypothetical protein
VQENHRADKNYFEQGENDRNGNREKELEKEEENYSL